MSDLASIVAKRIVERIQDRQLMDKRNAVIVDSLTQPISGFREFAFQCVRPSITPGGMSGGAYRRVVEVSLGLFISSPVDSPGEVTIAQDRLGDKAEIIVTYLEGFDCNELEIPLFGVSGFSEIRDYRPESSDGMLGLGIFMVEWSMRGEKWAELTKFQAVVNQEP